MLYNCYSSCFNFYYILKNDDDDDDEERNTRLEVKKKTLKKINVKLKDRMLQ